jgi:hypothetical protein
VVRALQLVWSRRKSSRARVPNLRRLEVMISKELGDWDCAGDGGGGGDGGGEEDRTGCTEQEESESGSGNP